MLYEVIIDEKSHVIFKSGSEIHWELFRRVEAEALPSPFLWSDDGCRVAFYGHYSYSSDWYSDEEDGLLTLRYTFVCDVSNKKILCAYEGHLQPMVWNTAQDGLVAEGVECYNEREWLIICGGLPPEMLDIRPVKPAFEPGKEPAIRYAGYGSISDKDPGRWLKCSKNYLLVRLNEKKLDAEYNRVMHEAPWAERSSQEDICRRVFEHVVCGKPY